MGLGRSTAIRHAMSALLLVLTALSGALFATITVTPPGTVDPAYNDSDPWVVNTDEFIIGFEADGTLRITAGSDVTVNGPVYVGDYAQEFEGLTGTLELTGLGSTFTVDPAGESELFIGPLAEGHVTVDDQAILTSHDTIIGGGPEEDGDGFVAGEGHATVSGAGQWDSGWMTVGGIGSGFLTIQENGSLVNSDVGEVGLMPDTVGNVIVEQSGAWALTEDLIVGVWGDGTLEVRTAGQVQSARGWIGGTDPELMEYDDDPAFEGLGNPDGTGTVLVTGENSVWDAGDSLVVGAWGTGTLDIEDQGKVTAAEVYIGGMPITLGAEEPFTRDLMPNGTGTVTVTDDGSLLEVTGGDTLYVGYSGTGTLNVEAGGDVTSDSVVIGAAPDTTGTVTVTGGGSTLTVEHEINVGAWGEGHLTVSAGGSVSAEELLIGGFDASDADDLPQAMLDDFGPGLGTGTVTVTGALSTLDAAERIYVGNYGEGTLNVELGGTVIGGEIAVGVAAGSHGIVNVSGDGSTLEADGDHGVEAEGYVPGVMIVGGYGTGEVTVSSQGELTVDDVLYVGGYPAEELDFEPEVPGAPDGTGTVTVTGEGSTLNARVLEIGYGGQGTLEITNGATATSGSAVIGVLAEGVGEVLVDNTANTWTNEDSIAVGGYGEGTLTIQNGGHVEVGDIVYIGGYDVEEFEEGNFGYPDNPDGTGTVTVTGADSLLEAEGIGVGIDGDGTLEILNGAQVEAEVAVVGAGENGVGNVLVDGQAGEQRSTWRIDSEDMDDAPAAEGEGNVVVSNGGQVIVNGDGILHVADKITVGSEGVGSMTISGGGTVRSEALDIGGVDPEFDTVEEYLADGVVFTEGTGDVTVTDSTLEVEDLFVGFAGSGTLDILDGALVTTDTAILGGIAGTTGEVDLDGGSIWNAGDNIVVGFWGHGDLTIAGASHVTTGEMYIGGAPFEMVAQEGQEFDADLVPDGTGVVTVTGDSVLTVEELFTLYVGYAGTGELNVEAGGAVTTESMVIGASPEVTGTVVVDGGSTLTADHEILVGAWGTGELTVSAGGNVATEEILIGGFDTSDADELPQGMLDDFGPGVGTGIVTVTGPLSTLDAEERIYVGNYGEGTLNVDLGGTVIGGEIAVGVAAGSHGIVNVSGDGSTLEADEDHGVEEEGYFPGVMIVGGYGTGEVTVSNQGELIVEDVLYVGGYPAEELDFEPEVPGDPDGTGTVTITGEGSTLTADVMSIGFSGEGTLNVLNDATVTSEAALIGVMAGGVGHVVVQNALDTWTNTEDVIVGAYGEGDLTVADSGHVVVGETLYIGGYDPQDVEEGDLGYAYDPDGTGTVTVTGVGSLLEAVGIGVGIDGDGTLEILNGAEVQAEAAVVGLGADGVGSVLVDGQVGENRSTWRIESDVQDDIPIAEGEGEVIVSNGGQIIVDGAGVLHVAEKITVGSEGDDSRMTISDGGFASSAMGVIGGYDPEFEDLADYFDPDTELNEGTGAVTVTGADSRWDTDYLEVGFSGDGTLTIEEGGYVWDLTGVVGMIEGVTGTVEVTGANSTWDNLNDLVIGAWGAGDLTVSAGGTVFATDAYIGGMPLSVLGAEDDPENTPAGTGTVMVTGEDSEFIVAAPASLYVGYTGTGTLEVLAGGYVESVTAGIGALPGSTGDVTVDGVHSGEGDVPSEWNNDGSAFVGGYGTGSLTVSAGGEVHIGDTLYIGGFDPEQANFVTVEGSDPDGTGDVTVTGAGSLLAIGGDQTLYVGYSGPGTLNVLAGGSVESEEATVGYEAGSVGAVTVSGPDSTWTASEQSIGRTGQGSLTISDSGTVTTNSAILGQMVGGSGEVLVTGADSGWQINNTLWVGYRGEGELTIAEGAQVESSTGILGEEATADGTVWVTGESSQWTVDNDLSIGYAGTGLVDVRDEGQLIAWNDLYIGGHAEGSGGTGVLNVSDGGRVFAQEVIVWETGTLTGDGTVSVLVPTTVHNHGTIAPGDDGIGTLTISGNVVFHEDSTYAVQINNNDESDRLQVSGDVTIDGGTVQVASVGTILGEHEYEIISADLVAGEFADLDTGLLNFEFEELTYPDGTSVWLHVTAANFNDADIARTYNQRQLAGALQEIAGPENPVTGAVQQLETIEEVRDSYDQLSGQTRPPLAPMTVAGSSKFLGTVTSRTQNVRTGLVAGAFDSSLTAAAGPDQAVGGSPAYATAVGGPTFAVGNGSSVLADRRWGIWGRGYGLIGDRDAEGGLAGYDYHVYGGSFGVDYQINESLLAGLVGGMSEGDVDFDRSRDSTDFDAAHIGLYASLAWDRWNVDSVFTYANLDYETRRYVDVVDERLTGDFDGYELAGYVELSRSFDLAPDLRLAPLASLQYTYLNLDSYTETGGDSALSFDEQSHESVRGSLGARLTKRLIESTGDFRADLQVRGRWVHEFGDDRASVDTAFASDPTVVFTVKDEEISRDSAVLGAGLSAELNRQTRAYLDYDTRLNSDESVHVFSASLQYRW